MSGLEKDTIGGFNSTIEKQKGEAGTALVSTVLFANDSEVLYDRVEIEKIEPMTEKQYFGPMEEKRYFAGDSTALCDAIGGAIDHIANVHKYMRDEDRPEKTIFVITTDGHENASRRYDADRVRKMVERQKMKYGWEFIFFGANIDAVETAKHYGISEERAANFANDEQGLSLRARAELEMISCLRFGENIREDWKDSLETDLRNRKK